MLKKYIGLCATILLAVGITAQAASLSPLMQRGAWLQPGGRMKLPTPTRVLLAGDSLMESLGPQLRTELAGYENLTLIPIGKKSTGLSRPDFYNWPLVLKQHMEKDNPHIVVFWVGTNDPQNIFGMTGLGEPCSRPWQRAYLSKIYEIMNIVGHYHAYLIFMGPPVVGDKKLDDQLAKINRLMAWACKVRRAGYVDTRKILADGKGRFRFSAPMKDGKDATIRYKDGVHITADGNQLVMDRLVLYLASCIRPGTLPDRPIGPTYRSGSGAITGSTKHR